ncbi:TniB family NTP-binding protein [Mesorhizobium sp. NZP2077]|uniref:TniB family NTP-binding protein n=1 Tax=Mesorhizobium sp. NZP2077 TaxID=2483404 RepID=UPI001FF077A1|nr:TniB family NTP-binding protein [Mesorhizobium sp. NZP2077]
MPSSHGCARSSPWSARRASSLKQSATIHLTQAAKDLLSEPDVLRVRAIQARRWIFYPRAKQALDRLNLLVDHPRGTRMPSVAIYGDSGMGKTMILEKFCDNNPSCFDPTTGVQAIPVLAIEMTGKPGERRLYAEILAALGAPQAPRADIVHMEQAALRLLKTVGVQVLVIDEIHNILAGSYREQRVVLNTLRFLSNRLQISLVCFGVIEAREAISGDVQLARRFGELTLNRWRPTNSSKRWSHPFCGICRFADRRCSRRNLCAEFCRSAAASLQIFSTRSRAWRPIRSRAA